MPPEKTKKNSRMLFLIAFLLVIGSGVAVAVYSLSGYSAWAKAKKLQNPVPATPDTIAAGAEIYREHCQSCHGRNGDGKGDRADELSIAPADFADSHKMSGATDGELFWEITRGQDPMPAFEDKLSDQQRWQAVDYVRTFVNRRSPASVPQSQPAKSP